MDDLLRPTHRIRIHSQWLVAAVFLTLAALVLNPYVSTNIDDAAFMLLARSLASGQGYRDLAYVGSPPHTYLPFGLPLLLMPSAWLWPASVIAQKLVVLLCGLGMVLASRLLPDDGERGLGRQVMILTAVCPLALSFSTNVWNDIPYCLSTVVCVWAYRRAVQRQKHKFGIGVLAIALLLGSYSIFVGALALFAAATIYLLLHCHWRLCAASVLAFGLAVGIWETRCFVLTKNHPTVYKDHFSKFAGGSQGRPIGETSLLRKVIRRGETVLNFQALGAAAALVPPAFISRIGHDCFPHFGFCELWGAPQQGPMPKWQLALGALCMLLIATGWVVKLLTRRDLRDIYFGGFVALLALGTPGTPGPMTRVLPFLFYYALVTANLIGQAGLRWRVTIRRTLFMALLIANLLASSTMVSLHVWRRWTVDPATDEGLTHLYPNDWAIRITAVRRVAGIAPAQARVLCRRGYAEVLHILSDLQMAPMPDHVEAHALLALAEDEADFVLAMRGTARNEQLLWLVRRESSAPFKVAFVLKSHQSEVFVLQRR